jgi:predicted dehydrogenase
MIRVVAIGTEGHAYNQLKRIFSLDRHFKLVGVSSDPLRREQGYELCREYGVPVFDNSDAMLQRLYGKTDAVFIFTGIDSHYRYTRQCLEARLEVFLEKPPVPTIQQLDALTELESKSNKRVAVLFQYLYSDLVQTLKRRIVAGEFGKVERVRSLATWQRSDEYFKRTTWCGAVKTAGGEWVLDGTLNNPLSHLLSKSLFLAGMEAGRMAVPLVVQGELYRVHDIESEDTSSVRIVCENGCVITHNATLCSASEVRSETVLDCERALIHYRDFNQIHIRYKDGRPSEVMEDSVDPFVHMLTDMAESFEMGRPYKVSLAMCRPFTLCVNGAFDSSGQAVHIDPAHIVKEVRNGRSLTLIRDIAPLMQRAHRSSSLLSEIQIPWARSGRPVDMKDYSYFPRRLPEDTVA